MTKHDIQSAGVAFFVPGPPRGKGRPRAAKRGKHITLYTPAETAAYESTVALAAQQAMAGQPLLDGPVEVIMRIVVPIAASWPKRRQAQALAGVALPINKPDSDNVVKAVFDAINGVVWRDDTQVVDMHVRKRYGATPGVQAIITPICTQETP